MIRKYYLYSHSFLVCRKKRNQRFSQVWFSHY